MRKVTYGTVSHRGGTVFAKPSGGWRMMVIDGEAHRTISDAAADLGVSTRTVNEYITKGIIPTPPAITQGLRDINVFPDEYMQRAKDSLRAHRERRRRPGKQGDGADHG